MKNNRRIFFPVLGLALLGGLALWTTFDRRADNPGRSPIQTAIAAAPAQAAPRSDPSDALPSIKPKSPNATAQATPPQSDIWTKFATAKVLESKERTTSDGTILRTTLIDYPGKYPRILVRETIVSDPRTGPVVAHQMAMVADHLLVQRAKGVPAAEFEQAIDRAGMSILAALSTEGLYRVAFGPAGIDALDQAIDRLARTNPVAFAEPDYIVSASDIESKRQVVVPGTGGAMVDPVANRLVTPDSFSEASAAAPDPEFVRQDGEKRLDLLPAGTRILTFDLPTFTGGAGSYRPNLVEQNFQVSQGAASISDRYVYIQNAVGSGYPNNGTFYARSLIGQSDFTVQHAESAAFTAVSVDLSEYSTVHRTPQTIIFTGYKAAGGTVTQTFTTDGVIDGTGPLPDFQTFTFAANFNGLVKLVANGTPNIFMIDNIGVLVEGGESPPEPTPPAPIAYQVTWDPPKHTVDQVPAVSGPYAPTSINFGAPRVRSSVGTMAGPALEMVGGTGDGSLGSGYQQIQFNLGRHAALYRLEFDAYLNQPDEFVIHADVGGSLAHSVRFLAGGSITGGAGTYPSAQVFRVRLEVDLSTQNARLYLNDVLRSTSALAMTAADLTDFRLHLSGTNAASRVGLDNILIEASGTTPPPLLGPILSVPSSLYYPVTNLGSTERRYLTLSNLGGQDLSINSITSNNSSYQVIETFPILILPGGFYSAKVDFSPLSPGAHNGTLTVASNDPNQPTKAVTVTGSASTPASLTLTPPSLSLSLAPEATSTPSVTIGNVAGNGTLYWSLVPDYVRPVPGPAPHSPVTPSDAYYSVSYGMKDPGATGAGIDATHAWAITTGSSLVKVAVIDSGVDPTHPDLAANIDTANGWNFITNTNNPMDDNGHGTHVAGTIAALGNNSLGVTGVSWNCKIVALKFLDVNGNGFTSDAVEAVNYAAARNIRITNSSWGGGSYSQSLHDAILASGTLFVAAAGNYGINNDATPHYPSSFDCFNILAVAATDSTDSLAGFSHYGATSVDLAAPGVGIASTYPGNQYAYMSGTSMATPHVSGAAALLLSQDPGLNPAQMKQLLMTGTDPKPTLSGKMVTGGRLNIYTSLRTGYAAWITAPTTSGTVLAGQSRPLSFAVDTQGLLPGTYSQAFYLDSNDPQNGHVLFPVNLQVSPPRTRFTVTLTPGTGQWRIDNGAWQPSGATVSGLDAGSHTIEYNSLPGYISPASETVVLTAGESLSVSRSYTVQTGLPAQLTVNLIPTNGRWRIDGGAWRNSGNTATGLLSGPHTVEYYTVSNYAAPAAETVTLAAGDNTLTRTYTQLAQLTVTLTPGTGRWRLDGGAWRNSGNTLSGLAPGNHSIEYYTLTNYATPATETVTLIAGANTLARTYAELAQLTLNLTPATSRWRLDGGPWRGSGFTHFSLPLGSHLIEYYDPAGTTALPQEAVILSAGPVTLVRTLLPANASAQLSVTLTPASAQWRVDGGAWQASGALLTGLTAGSHTIEYSSLAGYTAPATETVSLAAAQALSLSRSYSSLLAQLTITLTPSLGQWRVDAGSWQASGATVTGLAAGNHTVEYGSLAGFTAPATETVSLTTGQALSLSRSYSADIAYTAINLGTLGGVSAFATGINLSGTVAGYSYTTGGGLHAFRYSDGSMQDLGTLGGATSQAYAIDDSDNVVGSSSAAGGTHAFRHGAGGLLDLGTLGGAHSAASGINNSGTIVGHSYLASGITHAFRHSGGTLEDLGTLGGDRSEAKGVNDEGVVVGGASLSDGRYHAFRHSGGVMQDLGALGSANSTAYALNESGVIVGSTSWPGDGAYHAFRYSGGLMQDLGTLDGAAGSSSTAYSINESGAIVGWSSAGGASHAFIFQGDSMRDLNALVSLPGVYLKEAVGINDLGQIVANGSDNRAYVLTPTNAPGGLQMDLTPAIGRWRVDGGTWRAGGTPVLGLAIGDHTVEYDSLPGYTTPATETVTVSSGRLLRLSRSFPALLPAQLTVTLSPAAGQWRVDGGAWQASGATITGIAAGDHTVEYGSLSDYTSPATETVTLAAGQSLSISRSYTSQAAQLTVTLTPASGQWRVDGGAWQASGTTVNALSAGDHTVEYGVLAGYSSPANETIVLLPGQALSLNRTYTVATYTATDLRSGAGPSVGLSINLAGMVAGSYPPGTGTTRHAFRYADGVMQDLGTLAGSESNGYGINDAGVVIGQSTHSSGISWHAFRHDGTMHDLGALSTSENGGYSQGLAINASGVVVGRSGIGGSPIHAFRYSGGIMEDLGTLNPGYGSSTAHAINDAGVIVGWSDVNPGEGRAFRYSGGVMEDLGTLGGTGSAARALNESGVIVGEASLADFRNHAFRYSNGVMVDLGTLDGPQGFFSRAQGINESGDIVGGSSAGGDTRAFIVYNGGAMQDLNTLVATVPGVYFYDAYGINDLGQIVAHGSDGHGYVLTPINAPGGLQVKLVPATGRWRVDGGAWQDGGTPVLGLAIGNHVIEYSGQTGYDTPVTETVAIASGRLLQLTRSYAAAPPTASVNVSLSPVGISAQWRLNGGDWQSPETTLSNLAPGSHTIEFSLVEGYLAPAAQTITVASGETSYVYASYTPLGSVSVSLMPVMEARWRIDGGEWRPNVTTLIHVALGSHLIEFEDVPGYATPPAQTVTVTSGQTAYVYASYEPLTGLAQLSVSLSPIRGQWRIDGGEWRAHGAYVTNLALGEHTIEYRALPNYVSPPTETVTLTNGQSTYLDRAYQLAPTVQYSVTDLGDLGGPGGTNAAALNLPGMVTGTSHIAGGPARAFLYRDGVMQNLGTLGSDLYSLGYGLNDDGEVVGMSYSTVESIRPFVHRNGGMQDLGSLGGATGAGYDISNTGFAVGRSQANPTQHYAFIHDGTTMLSLGTLGGTDHVAYAINEGGTIVGAARVSAAYHAFRWRNGIMEDVNPLLNTDISYAYDVNEAGTLAGIRFIPGEDYRAFSLSADGVMQDLGRLGATHSYARAINGAGHVVGNSSADDGNHAFLHRGAGIEDLNHLVNLPGVVLEFAEDINDLGQIAANGSNGHAYLLTPVNAPGGLQLDLTPAIGQWRVDGGAWQSSGSPVLNLAIGSHTVEYGNLAGYATPATETVTVASGRLLQLNRAYATAPQAQLTVTLTPPTAQWRVDGGAWQVSGATVTGLAAGSHTLEFDAVAGYTSPATETVTLTAGQALSLDRSYTALAGQPAQLTVSLTPATAKWRLDGGSWRNSGTTATGLLSGPHTIEYYTLANYAAPATETVTLLAGTNTLARTYTELAQLTVTLTPATARWRVDGGSWRNSGYTLTGLAPGTHSVEYYTLTNYTAPATETVTLLAGANTLARTYTELAQLTVTLTPATARWRLDGGAWRSSGFTLYSLPPGAHTLEYFDPAGTTALPAETVTLAVGSASLTRTLLPPGVPQ